ncbi:MAG: hypothetical protein MUF15_18480 [Acidobacteria bacterium]|jgi:hypothetical protein|nr:hypothetical protein [Acidobacteriota bacterium]
MNSEECKPSNGKTTRGELKSRHVNLSHLGSGKTPFCVQLLQPPKPMDNRSWFMRHWSRILFGVAIFVMLFFWNWYIVPQKNHPPQTFNMEGNSIALGFSAPEYVFISNKSCIDVTVVNTSDVVFNGTITLAFSQPASLSITAENKGNTSFKITDLKSNAQFTKKIGFILNEAPKDKTLNFQFIAENSASKMIKTEWYAINLGPFYFLHSRFIALSASILFTIILGLFWERFKRLIFSE